ncbi:MAG: hypothetical protein M3Z04_14240, partial [Chloroflexota bacterium]|nr:hypothetical protein [Chloroflexota bacterium]
PATSNGHAETTFQLPAHLSSGQPIPTSDLYLVCLVAGQVDMGEGWGSLAFRFMPSDLPATGHALLGFWLTLMASGGVFVIAGSHLVRRKAGTVPGAAWPNSVTQAPPAPLCYADHRAIGDRTVRLRLISTVQYHHEHHHPDGGLWHGRRDARNRK